MPRTQSAPRPQRGRQDEPQQRGGTAVAVRTQPESDDEAMRRLVSAVSSKREQLTMLLAGQVDPERFITVALQAVQTQPALLKCTTLSILSSIRDSATYGLEPSGTLGDAALVPYDGKCTLQLQYRGIRKLAMRDGTVKVVTGSIVYDNDHFRIVAGSDPRIEHEPTLEVDRGNIKGAYAIARLANDELVYQWMPLADLLKRRAASKSFRYAEKDGRNDSTWHLWPEEMMTKTVVKRLCSEKLPLTPIARMALVADTMADVERPADARTVSVSASDARNRLLQRMGVGGNELSAGDQNRIDKAEAGPQSDDGQGTTSAETGTSAPAEAGVPMTTPASAPSEPQVGPAASGEVAAEGSGPETPSPVSTPDGEILEAEAASDPGPQPMTQEQLRRWLADRFIGLTAAQVSAREQFGEAATLASITDEQRQAVALAVADQAQ